MRQSLKSRVALYPSFCLILLLGACTPATESSDREPIYIGSFEVPPVLVESTAEDCQRHADAFRSAVTQLNKEVRAFNTEITTGCFKSSSWAKKIDKQISRNAEAAGYTKASLDNATGPYEAYKAIDEESKSNLYFAYRFEKNVIYVTIAHTTTEFAGFRSNVGN